MKPWLQVATPALSGALTAAAAGFAVAPCHVTFRPSDNKKIITTGSLAAGWQTKPGADAEQIRMAFANGASAYLIACGPSGIVVADLDVRGASGIEAWRGKQPGGLIVTTPSGGRHHYYRNDSQVGCPASGIPGVDIKGIGGGVFGPGSLDGAYQVLTSGPLPPWSALGLTLGKRHEAPLSVDRPSMPAGFFADISTPDVANKAIARTLAEITEHILTKGWEDAGFRKLLLAKSWFIGGYVGSGFISTPAATEALQSAIRAAGFEPDSDDEKIIESGLVKGSAEPLWVREPPPFIPESVAARLNGSGPSIHLPAEFWAARPLLGHIRAAAHSKGNSASAVLGVVLARLSSLVPGMLRIDTGVRMPAALNYYSILYGTRSVGKSSAAHQAEAMMPFFHDNDSASHSIGSGQGIAASYGSVNSDGEFEQTRFKAFFYAEEGSRLFKLARGAESTVIDVLKEAWTGQQFGQRNATAGLNRQVRNYSLGFWMGLQPTHAARLFSDESVDDGTLARFVWFAAADPDIPEHPMGLVGSQTLPWDLACALQCEHITVPESIRSELRRDNWLVSTGQQVREVGSEHAPLLRIKTAGLLALLDHRHYISDEDWQLAAMVLSASNAIAASVRADMAQRAGKTAAARAEAAASQAVTVAAKVRDAVENGETARIERLVTMIPDLVREHPDITQRGLVERLPRGDRAARSRSRAAIDLAIDRGLIILVGGTEAGLRSHASVVRLP